MEFVVGRESDQASPRGRQREEDLSGSILPDLGGQRGEDPRSGGGWPRGGESLLPSATSPPRWRGSQKREDIGTDMHRLCWKPKRQEITWETVSKGKELKLQTHFMLLCLAMDKAEQKGRALSSAADTLQRQLQQPNAVMGTR